MTGPSWLTLRWPSIFCALVLVCTCELIGIEVAHANSVNGCEHIRTTEIKSPDGQWLVRAYGKVCDLGIESSGAVLVDLVRTHLPDSSTTVLSIDMPSRDELWPKVKWESPQALIIQLPANAGVALQRASFQNVEIHVRFCPADPRERERWVAYRTAYHHWVNDMTNWGEARKRDPSTAGPRPAPPKVPEGRPPDNSCAL